VDYRKKAFRDKFKSAQEVLKVKSLQDVVSLKFRENVEHAEYSHLIDFISHDMMLKVVPLTGGFQGRAWLVTDTEGKGNILVEHETGLEILGVVGSVASLIGLLPILNSSWRYFRDRYRDRHNNGVELRQIDSDNLLVERKIPSIENYIFNIGFEENKKLIEKVNKLEHEVNKLKKILDKQNGKKQKTTKPQK